MSVRMEFYTESLTPTEIKALSAFFLALDGAAGPVRDAIIKPSVREKAGVAGEQVDPSPTKEAAPADPVGSEASASTEPKRRGRPKKEQPEPEPAAEPAAHVPTQGADVLTADAGTDAEPPAASDASSSSSATITLDTVKSAFLSLQERSGLQACRDLLEKFSTPLHQVKRVAELPEEVWAEAIKACNV